MPVAGDPQRPECGLQREGEPPERELVQGGVARQLRKRRARERDREQRRGDERAQEDLAPPAPHRPRGEERRLAVAVAHPADDAENAQLLRALRADADVAVVPGAAIEAAQRLLRALELGGRPASRAYVAASASRGRTSRRRGRFRPTTRRRAKRRAPSPPPGCSAAPSRRARRRPVRATSPSRGSGIDARKSASLSFWSSCAATPSGANEAATRPSRATASMRRMKALPTRNCVAPTTVCRTKRTAATSM